jgi:hypothetical protein
MNHRKREASKPIAIKANLRKSFTLISVVTEPLSGIAPACANGRRAARVPRAVIVSATFGGLGLGAPLAAPHSGILQGEPFYSQRWTFKPGEGICALNGINTSRFAYLKQNSAN